VTRSVHEGKQDFKINVVTRAYQEHNACSHWRLVAATLSLIDTGS